jgi:hypothetical protein
MKVEQLIATQQSALTQLSGRTDLIVANNGLPTLLENSLWPCCCRYRKNGSFFMDVHAGFARTKRFK